MDKFGDNVNEYKDCRNKGYPRKACVFSTAAKYATTAGSAAAGAGMTAAGMMSGQPVLVFSGVGFSYHSSQFGNLARDIVLSKYTPNKRSTANIDHKLLDQSFKQNKHINIPSSTSNQQTRIDTTLINWNNDFIKVKSFADEIISSSKNESKESKPLESSDQFIQPDQFDIMGLIDPYSIITNMVTSLASNLLTSLFSTDNDSPSELGIVMEYIGQCFTKLTELINNLRQEMHERFDILEDKLNHIYIDMTYFSNYLQTQTEELSNTMTKQYFNLNYRLDIIENNIACLEGLVGDGLSQIHWREIYEKIDHYTNYYSKYGTQIPQDKLCEIMDTVGQAIINPPMIEWLSRQYFKTKQHDELTDKNYFLTESTGQYIGWTLDKKILPFSMMRELCKFYQALRFDAARRGISYDADQVIVDRIKAHIRSFQTIITPIQITEKINIINENITQIEQIKTNVDDQCIESYRQKANNVISRKTNKLESVFTPIQQDEVQPGLGRTSKVNVHIDLKNNFNVNVSSFEMIKNTDTAIIVEFDKSNIPIYPMPFVAKRLRLSLLNTFVIAEYLNKGEIKYEYSIEWLPTDRFLMSRYTFCFAGNNTAYIPDTYQDGELNILFNVVIKVYWVKLGSKTLIGHYSKNNVRSYPLDLNDDFVSYDVGDWNHSRTYYSLTSHTISYLILKSLENTAISFTCDDNYQQIHDQIFEEINRITVPEKKRQIDEINRLTHNNLCLIRRNLRWLYSVTDNETMRHLLLNLNINNTTEIRQRLTGLNITQPLTFNFNTIINIFNDVVVRSVKTDNNSDNIRTTKKEKIKFIRTKIAELNTMLDELLSDE